MRNEFSRIRIQAKMPGTMLGQKLAMGIPMVRQDASGKQVQDTALFWTHYVDYQVEVEFEEYKNNALAFGRSNRNINGEYTNIGKSGGVIKTGDGLFAQMEVANTSFYNTFTIKMLENALYELSAGKLDFGQRKFIVRTGERGLMQASKAILKEGSGWTQFQYDGNKLGVIQKTSHTTAPNGGAIKFVTPQVTEFVAPNGVYVKFEVDPYYDDTVRNKIVHPDGGPAFSYRYDIMDIGTMEQPNIFKCQVKNQPDMRGYQSGPFANPFTGETNIYNASYDEDSAVLHKKATLGICVLDPTRTLSLIPNILQG